jgi:hypothetical protein
MRAGSVGAGVPAGAHQARPTQGRRFARLLFLAKLRNVQFIRPRYVAAEGPGLKALYLTTVFRRVKNHPSKQQRLAGDPDKTRRFPRRLALRGLGGGWLLGWARGNPHLPKAGRAVRRAPRSAQCSLRQVVGHSAACGAGGRTARAGSVASVCPEGHIRRDRP